MEWLRISSRQLSYMQYSIINYSHHAYFITKFVSFDAIYLFSDLFYLA